MQRERTLDGGGETINSLLGTIFSDILMHHLTCKELTVKVPPLASKECHRLIKLHNEHMPPWFSLGAWDLARMARVCKLWHEAANRALAHQRESLLQWASDCPGKTYVTIPSLPPGESLRLVFEVLLVNGKCVVISVPDDMRAGDSFTYDYRTSAIGEIKRWITSANDMPWELNENHASRLHRLQTEARVKMTPIIHLAQKRLAVYHPATAEVKKSFLEHWRSCKTAPCTRCGRCARLKREELAV